jgi:hypothetical protein
MLTLCRRCYIVMNIQNIYEDQPIMKTLTMTATNKSSKTEFQGANEGEQCRVASSGDYLVGMESSKAGTVVKVTETDMGEIETVKLYADYYVKNWYMNEDEALESAKEDIKLMTSLASHFEIGQKLLVKVYKTGRIAVTEL